MQTNLRLPPIILMLIIVTLFCASLFAETTEAVPEPTTWQALTSWQAIVAYLVFMAVVPAVQIGLKYARKRWSLILLMPAALALGACQSVPCSYVAADRATYAEVAAVYLEATEADATQSEAEKQIGRDVIDSWDHRIKAAEEDCTK